ncbi:MAG: adenylosuccinate lyase, partial [Nanoarchaeota archaeon]|nr:adenylosuccinate lyase [Nanoarchaeota archaeon]
YKKLKEHPEILAEPIQTILRREGYSGAYEKLKELTRGRKVTLDDLLKFVSELDVSEEVKEELFTLINKGPAAYVGEAQHIVDEVTFID